MLLNPHATSPLACGPSPRQQHALFLAAVHDVAAKSVADLAPGDAAADDIDVAPPGLVGTAADVDPADVDPDDVAPDDVVGLDPHLRDVAALASREADPGEPPADVVDDDVDVAPQDRAGAASPANMIDAPRAASTTSRRPSIVARAAGSAGVQLASR